ncbi:MAG TPA: 2-oxo acid dehydrogenase subunit E2, partial [Solirubrobacteraceae bacterium]|nr:2-oxo acid dehydrogenase subunit E2 [Solirubrobacteraceae bacterium]
MAVTTTVQVTMPQMGDSVTEGTVLEWHKQEGDAVAVDETIVEISTDKVDAEVPAPAAGTITKIHAGEGDTVQVGAVLAEITTNGAVPATAEAAVSDEGDAPDGTPAAEAAAEEEADQVDAQGNGAGAQAEAPPAEAPPPGATTLDIVAPPAGESVTEGTILEWTKQPGDAVQADETIVEISTDKVDMELPAPASGTLTEILAAEGETVTPGQVLGRMTVSEGAATAPAEPAPDAPAPAEVPDGAPVSPVARRAAAAEGVDLGGVEGSGPGGRVTKADVLAAAGNGAATATRPATPAPAAAPGGEATPLKGAAAMLARYMDESRSIPTATSFRTVAVTVMDARRKELKAAEKKVSFTHLIAYAIAIAATEDMPVMAHHFADVDGKPARMDDGQVNLGIAVDVEKKDGTRTLMVPVIRDAGRLPFTGFLAAFNDLIARARDNKLRADDLAGGNISLTNPGGIGTVASVPRLMTGQGTIVATGSIAYPVGLGNVGDMIGAEKVVTMTSTYDHRIIQGAESGRFLQRIEALL